MSRDLDDLPPGAWLTLFQPSYIHPARQPNWLYFQNFHMGAGRLLVMWRGLIL